MRYEIWVRKYDFAFHLRELRRNKDLTTLRGRTRRYFVKQALIASRMW